MQTSLTLADLQIDPERLLDDTEAALFRGGSTATLARDRWANTGIPFLKLGRKVAYRAGDVLAWIESRRVTTHSEAPRRGQSLADAPPDCALVTPT